MDLDAYVETIKPELLKCSELAKVEAQCVSENEDEVGVCTEKFFGKIKCFARLNAKFTAASADDVTAPIDRFLSCREAHKDDESAVQKQCAREYEAMARVTAPLYQKVQAFDPDGPCGAQLRRANKRGQSRDDQFDAVRCVAGVVCAEQLAQSAALLQRDAFTQKESEQIFEFQKCMARSELLVASWYGMLR